MGDINYVIKENILLLKKGNITFGKINDNNIYLIDNAGIFKQIDTSILKTEDEFLIVATKSYWIAAGKISKSLL